MLLIGGFTGLCLTIYIFFILRSAWFFARIPCPDQKKSELPFISVIIPARNEAPHIAECLHSVLKQNFPVKKFEVILINDHSTDATKGIALVISQKYSNLKVIDLADTGINSYKKAALSAGIAVAQGEIILQTDADCRVGKNWLSAMSSCFDSDTALVSGPVMLTYQKKWLQRFQALESLGLVAIGAGSMAAGKPNMCNGANMAYRKSVFTEVGGFEGIDGVASGDDELLLQKIHLQKKYGLQFARCKDAVVRTSALETWPELKAQRLRWVSKARSYKNRSVNRIQLIAYLGFWAFPIMGGMSLMSAKWLIPLSVLFLAKLAADYFLMYQSAKFFHKLHLLPWVFLLQFVYIPYVLWIGLAGNLVKTYTWKERKVQ
ncbi:MAG: glycosyltransferase [Bacteroidia bacterium]|nr:glycosyltransferase [Bacteroidia bacterium]